MWGQAQVYSERRPKSSSTVPVIISGKPKRHAQDEGIPKMSYTRTLRKSDSIG